MSSVRRIHPLEWGLLLIAAGLGATAFFLTPQGRDTVAELIAQALSAQSLFRVVNTSTPLPRVLLPTLVCGAFVYAVMRLNPHPPRLLRVVVMILLSGLYSIYMAFRFFVTLNFSTALNGVFSVLFFLAEAIIYTKSLSANFQMFWPTNRSLQASRLSELVKAGRFLPSVDIFLPSYSEPVEMLRRTILGCQVLRYPRKQIYLLDDQRRPAMRALAQELGCHYRDRPDNRHAKAGNMNAALPTSHGELIAVFDADFIPTEDFLERTVGFFSDAEVGLVQTPQNFYSVDAVSRNLGLPGIITEEQQVFFRAAQPGRDALGAIICHGTSFVIRRDALAEIGDFPGETLSEDWATSIKLQSRGYKCYYLNELLSAGVAAEFSSEFVTQRLRWARGTLQCFFASTNPLTVPGLSFVQRLAHLCGPLHYLAFLSRLFCLLLPLLFFSFGIVPLDTSAELLLFYLLPYVVCQALSLSWLTAGHRSAFWSEVYETMLCVPMTLTVLSTLWKPFGKPFKVSAKGDTRSKLTLNPFLGAPLIALLALYVPVLIYASLHASDFPNRSIFSLAMAWSTYSVALLWLSLQAAFDVPLRSKSIRFKQRVPATLRQGGLTWPVETAEISDADVVLAAAPEISGRRGLLLSLPACNLYDAPVRFQEDDTEPGVVLTFGQLSLEQHRALVASLFCRPGQWDERGVPEPVTFWRFLEAPFRMYPFAETR